MQISFVKETIQTICGDQREGHYCYLEVKASSAPPCCPERETGGLWLYLEKIVKTYLNNILYVSVKVLIHPRRLELEQVEYCSFVCVE